MACWYCWRVCVRQLAVAQYCLTSGCRRIARSRNPAIDIALSGLWSRSRRLGLETVSRRTKVSSRSRLEKNCQRLGLGHLRLVPKTNFRPNCAGHINKMSQFWAPRECFTFTAASAGTFCIHSR